MLAVLILGIGTLAQADPVVSGNLAATTSTLRAAAIATTSDVLSTFTVQGRDVAYNLYYWVTIGSATAVEIVPWGCATGLNDNTDGYMRCNDKATTVTGTTRGVIRYATTDVRGLNYAGFSVKATGSALGTSVRLDLRREQF